MELSDSVKASTHIHFLTEKGEIHVRRLDAELSREEISREIIRLLENALGREPLHISHTQEGKPFIIEMESLQLSVSHSAEWIALYFSKKECIGIDIEPGDERIQKAKPHFINDTEQVRFTSFTLADLHLIWGAKEAIYKYHGGKFTQLEKEVTILAIDPQTKTIASDSIHGRTTCFYTILDPCTYLIWV